ncbi:MAG: EboA domain-containing protein, partial [Cyanobacteria bacterium J06641_5]
MSVSIIDPDQRKTASELLQTWLARQVTPEGFAWLAEKQRQIAAGAPARVFFMAYSAVPRYTAKEDLRLTPEEQETAAKTCPGWAPQHWSADRAGRAWLLLALPSVETETFNQTLDMLLSAADIGEQIALFQSLPFLPNSESHRFRAAEGLRGNMTVVFNAIAQYNAFPAKVFDEAAWNQMVLKALFVGSELHPIWGLDTRANPTLARILRDYAHERWAAKREVSPELWRLVGPFIDEAEIADLDRVFQAADPVQQEAAALACALSGASVARDRLAQHPELQAKIEACLQKTELEDLYLPYKPKRRTRATTAREKGLGPLAEWIAR